MQGNSIVDMKKIMGYLGKWSMDEDGTLMAVKIITDEIVTKKLTVGSATVPNGITLYDEITHDAYCLKMRNGTMASDAGVCVSAVGSAGGAPPAPAPPPVASESASSGVATSTPAADAVAIPVETATSTNTTNTPTLP